jgi:hypothetical protein
MMIADVTATGDDNVLTAKSSEVSYRKEQLRRLQEEVIELGRPENRCIHHRSWPERLSHGPAELCKNQW